MSISMERARVWLEQGRADRAEPELRRALAEDPNEPIAHALLALCLLQLERNEEAVAEARSAVHAGPDDNFTHYALAAALRRRGELAVARTAVRESLRLAPESVAAWAMLGQIELDDRRWNDALEAADRGLALDPESVDSMNVRAFALRQLGQRTAADGAVLDALSRAPEDPTSHVVAGWQRIQQGDVDKAGEHFREALRLDPGNEDARGGLLEALKARNRFYRAMLAFSLWMSKQSRRAVWGILILLYLVPRYLRVVARDNPELRPVLIPIVVLIFGFIYLTWIMDPLFDAMLLWHPLGRHALDARERFRAKVVTCCLGLGLVSGLVGAVAGWPGFLMLAVALLSFVIPVSAALGVEGPRRRRSALSLLTVLGVLMLGALITGMVGMGDGREGWLVVAASMLVLYVAGLLGITILSNKWALDPRAD